MRLASAAVPNKEPLPFRSVMRCGQASKAVCLKGFAAMVCAVHATRDWQRRSCRR